MNINLSKIAIATTLALAVSSSMAAETNPNNISGIYAMGGIGAGGYQSASNSNNSGFMGQLGAGYLYALPNYNKVAVGAELSGTLYPSIKESGVFLGQNYSATITNYSINLLGVMRYFVNEKFSLVGKMGPSFFQSSLSIPAGSGTINVPNSSSSVGFMTDVGVAYHLNPIVAFTLDFNYSWQKYSFANYESATINPYGILAGVNINFGGMK
jgi:hypothetical protein